MSDEPDVTEVISSVVADDMAADFETLTDRVFAQVECSEDCARLFRPLVRWAVSRTHRSLVRRHFIQQRRAEMLAPTPEGKKAKRVTARTRPSFLRETIETFSERGRVPLGEMTIAEHESRIAHQLKLAGGIKRDIDKHTDAINRIKAAGAICLNDLPEYGGKAKAA